MGYSTLDEVKTELDLTTDDYDDMLMGMVDQAKGFIDTYCNRDFTATSTTKYFDGSPSPLFIDDLISVTTLKLDQDGDATYESTMATTDYILYPLNTTPKTRIKLSPNSTYGGFASGIKKGVEIAGSWGYQATVPDVVTRASIIQVCRWFKRKDTAYADVIGTSEFGSLIMYKGIDPDLLMTLTPLRKGNL